MPEWQKLKMEFRPGTQSQLTSLPFKGLMELQENGIWHGIFSPYFMGVVAAALASIAMYTVSQKNA